MDHKIPNLQNNTFKGLLLIIAGIILLLQVTGVINRSLDILIAAGALLLIAYGLLKMDAYNKLVDLFNRKR